MNNTVSMARPGGGAGPTRKGLHMDYRTVERLLDAITAGRIYRRPDLTYGDRRNGSRTVDDLLYKLDDRGWVDLRRDGTVVVNQAGQQWRDRPRKAHKPAAISPVAADGSRSGECDEQITNPHRSLIMPFQVTR